MKKRLGISLIAILAVIPVAASARDLTDIELGHAALDAADSYTMATTSFVKGAYSELGEVINTKQDKITSDNKLPSSLVSGLGTAAALDASAFATSSQGEKADTAVQTVTVNNTALTEDASGNVNITITTGDTAGTIKVNGQDVAVNGAVTSTSLQGLATETGVVATIANSTVPAMATWGSATVSHVSVETPTGGYTETMPQ